MTILSGFQSRAVYWDVSIEGVNVNSIFAQSIAAISVTYSIYKPTLARITVNAHSALDDFFQDGAKVLVQFGYSRFSMVPMISGKCMTRPQGDAEEHLNYTANIVEDVFSITNEEKSRVFGKLPTKNMVITMLTAMAGYALVLQIKDGTTKIPATAIPKQIGKTDLDFLYHCARKWNCICWVKNKTVYFIDSDAAHDFGCIDKTVHIDDISYAYPLKFRTRLYNNNVKSLSWNRTSSKSRGTPKASSYNRKGKAIDPSDYEIDAYGQIWQLKGEVLAECSTNPTKADKYLKVIFATATANTKETLRKYYKPITAKEATQRSNSSQGSHKGGKFEVIASLNIGDPYLRPPRLAELECGDGTKGSMELPNYIFRDGKKQKYFMNEIITQLSSGMIQTRMKMTMGK